MLVLTKKVKKMSTNTHKKKSKRPPKAPWSARKKQQELWSWYELYSRMGAPDKVNAEKVKEQLKELEDANPLLRKSNWK